jgi:hydroxymethylpyrimidine pyrophosphatase-like HAD family hydrolase
MRYRTLVFDYDGTLATDERVAPETIDALARAKSRGRDLILVTGRELDDLLDVFPEVSMFDRIVAENGAVVYAPATGRQRLLGDPPDPAFVDDLRSRGVSPLSAGQVIVATWQPHEHAVLDAIGRHGLELQVIFNRGAVMVLPPDVNKASGLAAALRDLRRSPRNTVCAGDAENDQAMFHHCERAVAVANAIQSVQKHAHLVMNAPDGSGIVEMIDRLLATDLRELDRISTQHDILIGVCEKRRPVMVPMAGTKLLITGQPGSGKSYCATGIIERVVERGYQTLVIDPEGDYGAIPGVIHLGDSARPPDVGDILHALKQPEHSVIANLLCVPVHERAAYFNALCDGVTGMREKNGFPHWLIVDEAHHVMPGWVTAPLLARANDRYGTVLLTVNPSNLDPLLLSTMTHVLALGTTSSESLASFARGAGVPPPDIPQPDLAQGEAVLWSPVTDATATCLRLTTSRAEHRRHLRKYAEGDMGEERSFYFRGPDASLNMRARNLFDFVALTGVIDDAVWTFHLEGNDYSRWILGTIGDRDLARAIEAIEECPGLSPASSREAIRAAIQDRYTASP